MATPQDERSPDTEVTVTLGGLEQLKHKMYCAGGIELLQELLKNVLGRRDSNEEKAAIAQEIWNDIYGDAKSVSVGNSRLAETIAQYKARASVTLEVSDTIELLLGHLANSQTRPLGAGTDA